jgi:hypothetical protein
LQYRGVTVTGVSNTPTNFDEIGASPDHIRELADSCRHLAHHLDLGVEITAEDVYGLRLLGDVLDHLAARADLAVRLIDELHS